MLLFRPTLMGNKLNDQMGFFVQLKIADEYTHRTELSVESFKLVKCRIPIDFY